MTNKPEITDSVRAAASAIVRKANAWATLDEAIILNRDNKSPATKDQQMADALAVASVINGKASIDDIDEAALGRCLKACGTEYVVEKFLERPLDKSRKAHGHKPSRS